MGSIDAPSPALLDQAPGRVPRPTSPTHLGAVTSARRRRKVVTPRPRLRARPAADSGSEAAGCPTETDSSHPRPRVVARRRLPVTRRRTASPISSMSTRSAERRVAVASVSSGGGDGPTSGHGFVPLYRRGTPRSSSLAPALARLLRAPVAGDGIGLVDGGGAVPEACPERPSSSAARASDEVGGLLMALDLEADQRGSSPAAGKGLIDDVLPGDANRPAFCMAPWLHLRDGTSGRSHWPPRRRRAGLTAYVIKLYQGTRKEVWHHP